MFAPAEVEPAAEFGAAVAVGDDLTIVGSPLRDGVAEDTGSVVIFDNSATGGARTELQSALAADGDRFGTAIALDGERFAVGAPLADSPLSNAGSVSIFEPNDDGDYNETIITAADGAINDRFGTAIALDGDRLAVAATGADDNGAQSGAVHVYDRNDDGEWEVVTKLTPTDGAEGDRFGTALTLVGDIVIVGAPNADVGDQADAGKVYVFEQTGDGVWEETQLAASTPQAEGGFGASVAADNARIAIGAGGDVDSETSGSAYVFDRSTTDDPSWAETELEPNLPEGAALRDFGTAVAMTGDRVVVGAPDDDDNNGAIFVFDQTIDGNWVPTRQAAPDDGAGSFGQSVALNPADGSIAVGAPNVNRSGSPRSGIAFRLADIP